MENRCRRIFRSIVTLLSFVILISLVGCSEKSDPVKLTDTVEQIQGLEGYAPPSLLAETFSKEISYEVSDISWSGETGTAEVKVITPDLAKIISDSIEKAIGECSMEDYDALLNKVKENVQNTLNSEGYPTLESIVEMKAEKVDEGYTLISNEEFEKIISGNLEEIFIQALMEGLANENSN